MNDFTSMAGDISTYHTTTVNKTESHDTRRRVSGKTIGTPQLSDKAAKYYEELKRKYSNMDFILVSNDQKEQAKAQAGSYANANRMVVLIDEDKVERMAEDDNYRRQYEGIISNAASGISQLAGSLSTTGAKVKGYGMQVNDNGTASYFAVLEKSTAAQKQRIEKKAAEKKEAKKNEMRKAEKEKQEERLSGKDDDTVTVTAGSIEELIQKIRDQEQLYMSDTGMTQSEKKVGQKFDFSV